MEKMSARERIVHMLLFEAVAIVLFVVLAVFITEKPALHLTGLAIGLSLIAMAWNYIYNLGFDNFFGHDRLARTVKMRIGHSIGFEIGMVVLSFPVIMWVLQYSFLTVLIMDIGAVLFFLFYTFVFNWSYDVIRHRLRSAVTI